MPVFEGKRQKKEERFCLSPFCLPPFTFCLLPSAFTFCLLPSAFATYTAFKGRTARPV
jgi:hypothetical protein